MTAWLVYVVASRFFISNAVLIAIPTTAGIGEIQHILAIKKIEVRFSYDVVVVVVIFSPDIPVVVLRSRTTMHTDGFYGVKPAKVEQLIFEMQNGFLAISFSQ